MKKKLLLVALLVGLGVALSVPHRLRADDGDPCTTLDGHSGYLMGGGDSGVETCVPNI